MKMMGGAGKRADVVKSGIEALDLVFRPGEVLVYVFYDIDVEKIRNRLASICKNYGLRRIQYSGFVGYLSRNRREELAVRLRDSLDGCIGKVLIQPVCEKDFRECKEFVKGQREADHDGHRP